MDAEEKIAFFHPSRQRFIEYDITRLVYSLGVKKKVVGLIAGLPIDGTFSMQGGMQQPWPIMDEIKKPFEVETIDESKGSIPDNVDVLMIVHPRSLSDKALYAIDQFVLKGGKALIALDPVPETAPRRRTFMGRRPGPARFGPAQAAQGLGRRLRQGCRRDRRQPASSGYPITSRARRSACPTSAIWSCREEDRSAADPVTARIKTLIFGVPGHFAKAEGGSTTVTPLVTTTDIAAAGKSADYRQQPDLLSLYRNYVPGDRKLWLAVRVTGNADSAFPKGPPIDEEAGKSDKKDDSDKAAGDDAKKPEKPVHIAKSQKPLNLILVADADFMETGFWAQKANAGEGAVYVPFANNADFVVNALDDLARPEPLIGLRGRGAPVRPFTVVDDLRKASENKLRAKQLELSQQLEDLRKKIADTRTRAGDGKTVLTAEQEETLRGYLAKFITVRQEQRAVLADLRKDVEALEARTKFYNIALIPLIVAVLAILVAVWRARRRRRRYETA